ncbi:MAG: response regulator transcription factor [Burkholderiales bacterium]|nr:response regulator transcription factor [Burkholderiales bacterium]
MTAEATPRRPRVLVADDHRMFAEALRGLLADTFELVGIAADGVELLELAARLAPELIVADISMPRLNGIDALARLRAVLPGARVVFLTMHRDVVYARRAIAEGACGYVLKHSAPNELVQALQAASEGRTFVSPSLAGDLVRALQRDPQGADPAATVTPRQRQILQLLAQGLSAKQIAARLDISPRTVEFHKYTLMESLGLHSSVELVRFAERHGIVLE